MKFNIVIGNPPYNNDLYLDFVENGHKISTDCSEFITPAKWQAKGGDKNEHFRETIVHYMSKIVFYSDCTDVFDIQLNGGVSYYIINKIKHNVTKIKNISYHNKWLESERERVLKINNEMCLSNIGYNIVNKLGSFRSYTPSVYGIDKFNLYINSLMPGLGDVDALILSKSYVFTKRNIGYHHNSTKELGIPDCGLLFSCETENELKSFISYCYSKFTRFLVFLSIAGLRSVEQDNWWRFVPNQTFDHIFTDEELYKKYNLTQKEISIIENTIKKRDIKDAVEFIEDYNVKK
jgi:site-specific DNA-methyltransferase (adenine-specific)